MLPNLFRGLCLSLPLNSYFKGIKWLIIVTLLLAIVQTPSLLVNTLGSGYEAEDESGAGPFPSLFRTTIGNLYGDTNGTVVQLSSDVCDAIPLYSDCRVPKSDVRARNQGGRAHPPRAPRSLPRVRRAFHRP